MAHDPIPKLIEALRGWSVTEIAKHAGVTRGAAERWRHGDSHPSPRPRARLVAAAKRQAEQLASLADQVERDGKARTVAKKRPARRPR